MISRRRLLAGMAGLPALSAAGCAVRGFRGGTLNVTLAGQALMAYPLCEDPYDGFDAVVAELRRGDLVFTDLEVAIRTPESGSATRDTGFLHTAPTEVLDCLRGMGFDSLALSNNHAWDLGTEGVMATRRAVLERGFIAAGTGANLDEATAAAVRDYAGLRVAIVAMATEKIREGAAATADRPGVNELRLADGVPLAEDEARILGSIRAARNSADVVVVYHHNHDWGDDMRMTRPWAKDFARDCADAGADLYVSHGSPLLHGAAYHRDSLLLFGLGSLVFHSRTDIGYYPPEVWESAIVHCRVEAGRVLSAEVVPVLLNERGDDPGRQYETRGRPRLAEGADAARILNRLGALCGELGQELVIADGRGTLNPD